ncbi:hypothetical protein [Bradyrhizobium sp. 25ACV]
MSVRGHRPGNQEITFLLKNSLGAGISDEKPLDINQRALEAGIAKVHYGAIDGKPPRAQGRVFDDGEHAFKAREQILAELAVTAGASAAPRSCACDICTLHSNCAAKDADRAQHRVLPALAYERGRSELK